MSEGTILETPPPVEAATPTKTELTATDLANMTCGYVVGLTTDGNFVFHVLGTDPGLVQLLGLHQYADYRLQMARDINQSYGVPLLAQQLDNVQKMLKVVLNMLTDQSKSSLGSLLKK